MHKQGHLTSINQRAIPCHIMSSSAIKAGEKKKLGGGGGGGGTGRQGTDI